MERAGFKPDGKTRGKKDGATFKLVVTSTQYDHEVTSHALPAHISKLGSRWNIDTGCSDHICNDRAFLESYTLVSRPTTIQRARGTLSAVGIRNVPLTVETKNGTKNKIVP